MNDLRFRSPITTGAPGITPRQEQQRARQQQPQGPSFQAVLQELQQSQKALQQTIQEVQKPLPPMEELAPIQEVTFSRREVTFSRHAAQRVQQRGIELNATHMARLTRGVELAEQKGLGETLILVDRTAFLVNVPSGKVITTLEGGELQGNVFTNIDGTVII